MRYYQASCSLERAYYLQDGMKIVHLSSSLHSGEALTRWTKAMKTTYSCTTKIDLKIDGFVK